MARCKLVELATRTFSKQDEATNFFKAMLGRYKPGQTVTDNDALDLIALIERHPEREQKVGKGIAKFQVMATEHGTNCFRVVRHDDTGTDFSYRSCVTGRPPSRKQEVSQAFRQVVRIDLLRKRDEFFSSHADADGMIICAKSKERILKTDAHIDHLPPMTFEVIVTTFLAGQGIGIDDVALSAGQDEQTAPEIVDQTLAESFRAYHARVAKLDMVKSRVNLAQSAPNRIKHGRMDLM
jgi:hypothetical protein